MLTFKKFKTFACLSASLLTLSSCVTGGASASNNGWGAGVGAVLNPEMLNTVLGNLSGQTTLGSLTNTEIIQGLKEALNIGSGNVVSKLGVLNGFNGDPQIRIPLPDKLQQVDQALSLVGMGSLTDDLELRLNRAAEAATPKAKELFISAISQMTINDAKNILTGPNNAATQYLRNAMGPQLLSDIEPIIQNTLAQAGAIQAYDQVVGRYQQIPLVSSLAGASKAQLNDYVAEKALDGIFYYVAKEEAAIRENPAKRTTEILQRVFGAI